MRSRDNVRGDLGPAAPQLLSCFIPQRSRRHKIHQGKVQQNPVLWKEEVEVFGKILYGDPTKKVCEAVDLVPLSCLVIGSRGLSTLKRALMGSVSTYVVNHAACPVTVVKENM
ncbi:Universal stress protein A-like protein [Triticum urartu]|uniref:Universal stress protein A-like protein n=1 Tax=Triticum urartu TaxID=4572 RepID=M8B348_TRIUA|nr:Universal stress protein A-like protein [Triticum urartu]